MSDFPSIQFVSAPSQAATLRYDFNDRDATGRRAHPLGADGLDLGVPSFSGEPEGVGFDYGYRRMHLTQRIEGSRQLALAKMSLLARELLRPTNWLRVQWAAGSTPFYFKTFRGEPGALDLENSGVDIWDVSVPLTAEGFAYGPRETIPQVQIIQAPADLTGPTRYAMRYVLPAIKGDAPAPLRVALTPAATSNAGPKASWMIGCVSGEAAMSDPVADIGTGDGLTAGTGTAAPTTNASYFNGSYREVTIGASSFVERLSGNLPSVPPGRYKVLLRYQAPSVSGADKPYLFQFGTAFSSSFAPVYGNAVRVTVPSSGTTIIYRGFVDLGEFNLPAELSIPENTTDTLPGTATAPYFSLKIGTADGTAGSVNIDAIKLIPVTGIPVENVSLLTALWSKNPPINLSGTVLVGIFDGDTEFYWSTQNGLLYPSQPTCTGAYPMADPAAARNLLVVIAINHGNNLTEAGPATTTALNAQTAVDVSYHPRYLYLGDGT